MADLNVVTAAWRLSVRLSVRLAVIIYRGQQRTALVRGVSGRRAVRSLEMPAIVPKNARNLKTAPFERTHVRRYNAKCFSRSMNLSRGFIVIKCTCVKLWFLQTQHAKLYQMGMPSLLRHCFRAFYTLLYAASGKNIALHLPYAIEGRINKFQFWLIFFHGRRW